VLLSDNESFGEGPARGLRRVQTRRSRERLNGLDSQVGELNALVQNGDRDALKRRCLDIAEALQ
jgi:hypothetical protein